MTKKNLGGLKKYTKNELQKFECTKPLLQYVHDYYPDRFELEYFEFEPPKAFDLYDLLSVGHITLGDKKIIFGIEASEEEFTQYDFLSKKLGPGMIVHKRVLNILNKECPDDFQALPIIIKNLDPKGKQFENKDFWLINVLNEVEAIDRQNSEITISPNGVEYVRKKALKDNCMGNHLISREPVLFRVIFHPSLAKHFINSRGVQFLTDEEAPI